MFTPLLVVAASAVFFNRAMTAFFYWRHSNLHDSLLASYSYIVPTDIEVMVGHVFPQRGAAKRLMEKAASVIRIMCCGHLSWWDLRLLEEYLLRTS